MDEKAECEICGLPMLDGSPGLGEYRCTRHGCCRATVAAKIRGFESQIDEANKRADTFRKAVGTIAKICKRPSPQFPERMDRMTPIEVAIASVACSLSGDITSVLEIAERALSDTKRKTK